MSKLRFAAALPLVQVTIAIIALLWRYRLSHKELLFPAVSLLYHGLNAPAWLVSGLIIGALESFASMTSLPVRWLVVPIYGIPLREVLFILLVAALWLLVGRAVDTLRNSGQAKTATLGTFVWNLFLFSLGAALSVGAIHGIEELGSSGEFLGQKPFVYFSLPGELLLIAWSLLLLWLPTKRIVRSFRARLLRIGHSESHI